MTTTIKVNPALPKNAGVDDALAAELYKALGSHRIALVEFQVSERTEIADDEDKAPSARLSIVNVEFANGDVDEDLLRRALRSRFEVRTALGTLDEGAQLKTVEDPTSPSYLQAMCDVITSTGEVGAYPAKATMSTDGRRLTIEIAATSEAAAPR